jgi:hypothetical protein
MAEVKKAYKILFGNQKERRPLGSPGVGGRIML